MKLYTLIIVACMMLYSCSESESKKIFIKSVKLENNKRVDWYFYSLLSNFSKSHLQLHDNNSNAVNIFESFYVTDIKKQTDTLTIQVYKNDYIIDTIKLKTLNMVVKIDTTGGIWNQASSRLARLKRNKVDVFNAHFIDSYCPIGECY